MVSGETNTVNPMLIMWDLKEGKRLASIRPHSNALICAAFSASGSMLATVGLDAQHRYQISVWDIQTLLRESVPSKGTSNTNIIYGFKSLSNPSANGNPNSLICRQISDFDVHRVRFCPVDETSLVSCGRENIRFWRIRKGHLPGRPVLLNEYSRGFIFKDLAFYDESGHAERSGRKEKSGHTSSSNMADFCVFVCGNKGLVLKIDGRSEQVLCAYQLHKASVNILCLSIHSGYCVTGADDFKLRIWYRKKNNCFSLEFFNHCFFFFFFFFYFFIAFLNDSMF